MTNREKLLKEMKKINDSWEIGTYYDLMEQLSRAQLKKVIDELNSEYTDIDVSINRKPYVVELETIDNEKDFIVITKAEYISRYGDERYED